MGAVNETLKIPSPEVTDTFVGAAATVAGTMSTSVVAVPLPIAFTALIATLYVVPFAKAVEPSALEVEIESDVDRPPPSVRVRQFVPPLVVYSKEVTAAPAGSAGAVNETLITVFPALISTSVGAPGVVPGVDELLEVAVPFPIRFIALIWML